MSKSRRAPTPLIWNPNVQVVFDSAGNPYARTEERLLQLRGIPAEMLSAVVEHANGPQAEQAVFEALGGRYPLVHVRDALRALTEAHILIPRDPVEATRPVLHTDGSSEKRPRQAPVLLIGNGRLAEALRDAIRLRGLQVGTWMPLEFSSCTSPEFLRFERERVINGDSVAGRPHAESERFDQVVESVTPSNLRAVLAAARVAVCALEGVPYRALFDVNEAVLDGGTPCVFVGASSAGARIGPTVVPGLTACFRCAALREDPLPPPLNDVLEHLRSPATHSPDAFVLSAVVRQCVDEVASILAHGSPKLAASMIRLGSDGRPERHPLLPSGDCPSCTEGRAGSASGPLARAANLEAAAQIGRLWPISPRSEAAASSDAYRTVGILGGGTAGYLTALAFRAMRPELQITLIESSRIPVIGVGEATTPELVKFLHGTRFLGLDIVDFFDRVRPSLKLGIKFQWGLPAPYEFTFPFQRGRLLESQLYESTINDQSLGAMLMMRDRAPLFPDSGSAERERSLLHLVRFAYHLDNASFVRYLREEARRAGVGHIDTVIGEAQLSDDGGTVEALIDEDGRRHSFDLYIDCSGFRSFLLEEKLRSRFLSYAGSLFTDHAVTANVPHGGTVKPYTLAETMKSGWCWNIPFETDDHRGYVFSSAFTNVDEAIDEMRSRNSGMSEPAIVKFRSGRHAHFWKGNVIAMGNSYGFVEPLESTALHMLVLQLEILTTHFPPSREDEAVKAVLNEKVGRRWDALRWFLAIHYRFNRRLNTPFWRAARNDVDVSGAEDRVALFRERAPLSYRPSAFYTLLPPEFFSDDHAFDTLLVGQHVPARWLRPVADRATWRRHRALLRAVAADAFPQREGLQRLRERPDVLREFATREDSWLHTWVPA